MDAGDLFDVIHVIYEEDIIPLWDQHIDVKDRAREAIYPMLYGRPYRFSTTTSNNPVDIEDDNLEHGTGWEHAGGSGDSRETKPFIPVSSEEDLMKVLDAPMGG